MEIIKEIMYREHISQEEVGRALGMSQQSVSAMLRRDIKAEKLAEVCEAIGAELIIRKGSEEWKLGRY